MCLLSESPKTVGVRNEDQPSGALRLYLQTGQVDAIYLSLLSAPVDSSTTNDNGFLLNMGQLGTQSYRARKQERISRDKRPVRKAICQTRLFTSTARAITYN